MALPIALTVTEAARLALLDFLRHCEPRSVITVSWHEASAKIEPLADATLRFQDTGPGWGVGAYARNKIPEAEIVTISGIEFCFAQGHISERLNGKTLDYRGGSFCVA